MLLLFLLLRLLPLLFCTFLALSNHLHKERIKTNTAVPVHQRERDRMWHCR